MGETQVNVSANYLARQFDRTLFEKIAEAIWDDVVEPGDFTLGKPLQEFERRFSELVAGREVIAVNSGTEALILALKALGIGPGDEVITVPNTFYATVGAIVAVGATPKFCDVDASHQMDPAAVRFTTATRAIMPVWLGGTPPDLSRLVPWARERGVKVVEDSCQAVGASHLGPAGTWGDAAAFSFHPLKPLLVWGDGGAVVLPRGINSRQGPEKSYRGQDQWLRIYRDHGKLTRDSICLWGVNARMHTLQCVVALHGLAGLEAAITKRRVLAAQMDVELGKIQGITIPVRRGKSSWRSYVIEAEERDRLKAALIADGIEAAIHYPTPLHLQPPGRALGYGPGDFPVCERQATRMLTLPCHEYLRPEEVEYMCERVRAFYE